MILPSRLIFYDASYRLDGGTTTLYARDEQGVEHRILLPRNMDSQRCPTTDQFYFDGELVPACSPLESNLLRLLKEAELTSRSAPQPGSLRLKPSYGVAGDDLKRLLSSTPEANLRRLVNNVITYLESDSYGSTDTPPIG